jgi:DNA-binding transcriptional MerR regulator
MTITRSDPDFSGNAELDLVPPASPATGNGHARASGKSVSAFRTISEVSAELDVPQHVLRFWESKFTQLRPLKRGGGRRYYRPEDLALLRRIHTLLYSEGYTIKGVQKVLRVSRNGAKDEITAEPAQPTAEVAPADVPTTSSGVSESLLRELLSELKALRAMLG